MHKSVNLLQLLSASRDLANRAGILIKNVFESGNLRLIDKAQATTNTNTSTAAASASASASASAKKKVIDPQTIADIAAQQLIISSLTATFPGLTVIGEEEQEQALISPIKPILTLPEYYYNSENECAKWINHQEYESIFNQNLLTSDVCVWVDPIDGTQEFTEGIKSAVTTLIGIAYKGNPIAGVIGRPFSEQTVFGVAGVPLIFWERRSASQTQTETPHKQTANNNSNNNSDSSEFDFDAVRFEELMGDIHSVSVLRQSMHFDTRNDQRRCIICSRSHLDAKTVAYIDQCKPSDVLKRGGCGGKILMILEGEADAYVHYSPGTKKWDTCACQCLLECIGGSISEPDGKMLDYSRHVSHPNANGVIASWKKGAYHQSFCNA